MNWWNDLWLNEGFADYIAYRCLDSILPEWRMVLKRYSFMRITEFEIKLLRLDSP